MLGVRSSGCEIPQDVRRLKGSESCLLLCKGKCCVIVIVIVCKCNYGVCSPEWRASFDCPPRSNATPMQQQQLMQQQQTWLERAARHTHTRVEAGLGEMMEMFGSAWEAAVGVCS